MRSTIGSRFAAQARTGGRTRRRSSSEACKAARIRVHFTSINITNLTLFHDCFAGKAGRPDLQEFKLSLRGATGLAHDAVSTLLRLPVLTELDVSGCPRISAMDRMRLVAKVCSCCYFADKRWADA